MFDEGTVVGLISEYNRSKDQKLLNELCKHFLPLVKYILQSSSEDPDFDDLVQEGMLRVVYAIPKYEPSKGKAYSFFTTCIKNRVNTVLSSRSSKEIPVDPQEYLEDDDNLIYEVSDEDQHITNFIDKITWRVTNPREIQACNFFRTHFRSTNNPHHRDNVIKSAAIIYNLTYTEAEFCLNLVVVTLRRKLLNAAQIRV